jgi:hypothetical protein
MSTARNCILCVLSSIHILANGLTRRKVQYQHSFTHNCVTRMSHLMINEVWFEACRCCTGTSYHPVFWKHLSNVCDRHLLSVTQLEQCTNEKTMLVTPRRHVAPAIDYYYGTIMAHLFSLHASYMNGKIQYVCPWNSCGEARVTDYAYVLDIVIPNARWKNCVRPQHDPPPRLSLLFCGEIKPSAHQRCRLDD